jgi:hypothetical protein
VVQSRCVVDTSQSNTFQICKAKKKKKRKKKRNKEKQKQKQKKKFENQAIASQALFPLFS